MIKKIKEFAEIFVSALLMGTGFAAGLYIVTGISKLF